MAARSHEPDHHDGQRTVDVGSGGEANGIGNHRGKGNADNHSNQLKHLAQSVGLGPGSFGGEQLREQSAVVDVNQRIQGACEHVHQQHIGKRGARSQKCRRVEKQHKAQHQQRRADNQPGTAAAPLGPGAVRQEAVHRIVNGVQERVQKQDQRILGCGNQAQLVHIEKRGVGFEHVHGDGGSEHPHRVAQGAGGLHGTGFQLFHGNAPFFRPGGMMDMLSITRPLPSVCKVN